MRTLAEINAEIADIEAEAAPVRERAQVLGVALHRLMLEKQEACTHPPQSCREGEYAYSSRPFMVCVDCGLGEEMWGSGTDHFKHVEHKRVVARLSYDEAWRLVKRFRSQETMYREKYPERFDEKGRERS